MVEQSVHVVEFDAELQILLDDVLYGNRQRDHNSARLCVCRQQRRRVALDLLLVEIGHFLWHQVIILASASSGRGLGHHASFTFCACRASRAMSSAVRPLVVRRSAASSTGRRLMISEMSVDTRPARASSSSASHPMILAIALTLSSTGGENSSRSTFDK